MNRQEFLAWEQASRDTIDFKRCYVDVAGEDLVAGLLLSQILYWHLPSKDGGDKLIIVRDGEKWLAKGREDWWDECRISPKQYDRAAARLVSLGLIECRVMRFGGNPTTHTRICWDVFLRDLTHIMMRVAGGTSATEGTSATKGKLVLPQRSKTKLTKGEELKSPVGEERHSQKVKLDVADSCNSLTETTAETPSEIPTKNSVKKKTPESFRKIAFVGFSEEDMARINKTVEVLNDETSRVEYESLLIRCLEQGRLDAWDLAVTATRKVTCGVGLRKSPINHFRHILLSWLNEFPAATAERVKRSMNKDTREFEAHLETQKAAHARDLSAIQGRVNPPARSPEASMTYQTDDDIEDDVDFDDPDFSPNIVLDGDLTPTGEMMTAVLRQATRQEAPALPAPPVAVPVARPAAAPAQSLDDILAALPVGRRDAALELARDEVKVQNSVIWQRGEHKVGAQVLVKQALVQVVAEMTNQEEFETI